MAYYFERPKKFYFELTIFFGTQGMIKSLDNFSKIDCYRYLYVNCYLTN